ncbi:MAG TPA: DUF6298 domain-containing protein [Verrucomicrobiae bacterium]|nr:DUF6298 domain-containing protein [Verrucomicrobiae bacterium]
MKTFLLLFTFGFVLTAGAAPEKLSPIISIGPDGHLVYYPDEHGNRVPDFSTCGYAGGDKDIPDAPARVIVPPVAGDETARIQKAIDYVAGLPMGPDGIRGAVLLLKGRHEVSGGLQITNSGVVLRGQGMGENGTLLVATGMDRRTLIRVAGQNDLSRIPNSNWEIADDHVPVGATSFHVRDATGLKVGDTVFVIRPSTRPWIGALGMTEFGGGIGDWRLVWHAGSYDLTWDRVLQKVDGNRVTVDAPITTAIESKFGGGRVETYSWPGRISRIGVENLRLESAYDAGNPRDENHSWFAITMENAENTWVRQVTFVHFAGSAVAIYDSCQWVTVEDCLSLAPVSEMGGWRRDTFFTMGQQTLFLRCWAEHGRHDFAAGFCAAGPNAFVQCEDTLPTADSGALASWASGTLFDNVRIDGNGLSLMNRGDAGEGAGWSAANSVLWQCDASKISCESPPTAQNWAFGSWGEFEGNGIWRSSNDHVRPESLFVAQVADRLGAAAAAKIKLMPRSMEEYSNPSEQQAAELIAAARKPAPQLSNFIAAAETRNPIPAEPGTAKPVDELPTPPSVFRPPSAVLSLTNGWLVCNGKLLAGNTASINWWRGNMRPSEAKNYGINLTRFAPGRIGPGFTDDLSAVADGMVSKNQVALDHHYGLWYDRRREDHERVRRENGDVWGPFYEQPFARSGQGTAWDGLSKYDLTKFNPWYWSRLKQFADICDERGLVLFNENYFQHNILEAGAHWVDCPWRSANNINHTGFPEPPPFAGDKRIFMAEQFYDVSDPVRRKLHENFIRQNLNNFTNEPNVIQFTSAEFTGPLAFEQFWLDTIADWERDHGCSRRREEADGPTRAGHRLLTSAATKPIIALAAPKDVQDAILADPQRRAVVDVICFRYWWRTDKGLFAPKGGQNLSPRQFERKWHGGTPTDMDLAAMAAEYRHKFPGKAVIASGEDANLKGSWAFLCAGGSMPDLPETTDSQLLDAIPQMQPWPEAAGKNRWVLRERGRQYLVYSSDKSELDLSAESGSFQLHVVDPRTGQVATRSETIPAGRTINVPPGVVWLVKD